MRGGRLLSCPTDVSPRESIVRLPRVTPPADSYFHISKSNSALARGCIGVVVHDTHNFAIMIPRTGGLSRAVIDPKRGDPSDFYASPSPSRYSFCRRGTSAFFIAIMRYSKCYRNRPPEKKHLRAPESASRGIKIREERIDFPTPDIFEYSSISLAIGN